MTDPVNHPSHYTHGPVEVIDVIEGFGFDSDYCLGNVLKYIFRAKHKGHERQDLEKAAWYLNRKIATLKSSEEERGGNLKGIDFERDVLRYGEPINMRAVAKGHEK